jgi:ribosomal RNA-processing protein 17
LIKPIEPVLEEESSASESNNEQEWDGIPEPPEVDHEAEYIEEDLYTTVTVEAMDLSQGGLRKAEKGAEKEAEKGAEKDSNNSEDEKPEFVKPSPSQRKGKRIWTKHKPERDGQASKKKRKKFRYENKAERKMTRIKEKSRNSRQAQARRSG